MTPPPRGARRRRSGVVGAALLATLFATGVGASPSRVTPYALHDAARDGDVDEVARLLDAGVPPDAERPGDRSCALGVAANQGHVAIVDLLLAAGAGARCGPEGWPPLVAAARGGHLAVVDRLLAVGAGDPPTLTAALAIAAEAGHPKTALRLVAAGASLESRDEAGMTPLLLAARAGRPATAVALLDAGADVDATDGEGRSALHWASWRRHDEVVRALLARGSSPDLRDARGDRAFLDAADVGAAIGRMRAAAAAAASPSACGAVLLAATPGVEPSGDWTLWGAPDRPEPDATAWALDGDGPARRMRVAATEVDACAARWWNVRLAPAEAERSRGGETGAAVLGAASRPTAAAIPPRAGLPWGVFPETVESTADLDGDGAGDLVLRSFCCGSDWLPGSGPPACDYTCWESWSRTESGWGLCATGGPC